MAIIRNLRVKLNLKLAILSIILLLALFLISFNTTFFAKNSITNEDILNALKIDKNLIEPKVIIKYITNCSNQSKPIIQPQPLVQIEKAKIDYLSKYPFILDCKNEYNKWKPSDPKETVEPNFSQASPKELHDLRIIRGVVVHFPIDKIEPFLPELKWLYNSWLYMQTFEPSKWRTDLIIFTENKPEVFSKQDLFLNELNCSFTNKRTRPEEEPMCTLINYKPIIYRTVQEPVNKEYLGKLDTKGLYNYLLNDVNIFSENKTDFIPFYNFIIEKTNKYPNLDSVLVTFDGYEYFKSAGFDFIIRTDMDVFLTPLFGQATLLHCNDFYTGGGGYSTNFNMKRLARIAEDINFGYASKWSIGSSWYSTPEQLRLGSYLSSFIQGYLTFEEFTHPEKNGQIGVMNWPDWHFGVLSMYGGHLALNHLNGINNINLYILRSQIDFYSTNDFSIFLPLHIHVYHTDEMFSKFQFKAGNYDKLNLTQEVPQKVKGFALHMALEAKRTPFKQLAEKLKLQSKLKN